MLYTRKRVAFEEIGQKVVWDLLLNRPVNIANLNPVIQSLESNTLGVLSIS